VQTGGIHSSGPPLRYQGGPTVDNQMAATSYNSVAFAPYGHGPAAASVDFLADSLGDDACDFVASLGHHTLDAPP
jgi:hypothetical protein